MTSNSVFLGVRPIPPLQEVGWEVRVLSHSDYSTVLAVINEYVNLTVGPELNAAGAGSVAIGAGSITMALDSPFWDTTLQGGDDATALLDYEHLWQCYEDGVLRFEFLGRSVEETLLEDTETRVVVISGPGTAEVLSWAKVLPRDFPTPPPPSTDPLQPKGIWQFPIGTSAMKIFLTLLKAAQGRGTAPWVNYTFTATHDSAGVPWADVTTQFETLNPISPGLGTDLLTQLDIASGRDLQQPAGLRVDWVMRPGFLLDVRSTIGARRENQVVFFEGNMLVKQRARIRDEVANYVVVRDDDGNTSLATDTDSINRWQRREALQQEAVVTPTTSEDAPIMRARRQRIARILLEQHKLEKSSWTITVPYSTPGRRVFRDFDLGDWIGVSSYVPGRGSAVDAYRVMAITVSVTSDAEPALELVLESVLDSRLQNLEKQLTKVLHTINMANGNGSGNELPPTPDEDSTLHDGPDGRRWEPPPDFPSGPDFGNGVRVFIQPNDPGDEANTGDFWYQLDA